MIIRGPVYNYIDALIQSDVSIVAEIELPIRQALLVKDGTTLEDIDTVYSHAQGIIQGSAWLNKNLEKAEVIEVSSTAEGAKMVMESAQNNVAAIASEMAAKVYGLEVFASNIQENEDNQTRFFVLSNNEACKSEHERMVFMAKGDAKDLNDLLSKIDQQNLELIYLHDRPLQTELGEYIYLIECTKGDYEDYLEITTLKSFEFKYYGTFSVY